MTAVHAIDMYYEECVTVTRHAITPKQLLPTRFSLTTARLEQDGWSATGIGAEVKSGTVSDRTSYRQNLCSWDVP